MTWLRSCALLFVIACTPAAAPAPTTMPTTTTTTPPATTPPTDTPAQQPPAGAVCGTRGAAACAANEFCNYAPGDECGAADKPGHCATKPQMCPRIYAPVCGCDHKTYPNSCDAASAGMGVSKPGACT